MEESRDLFNQLEQGSLESPTNFDKISTFQWKWSTFQSKIKESRKTLLLSSIGIPVENLTGEQLDRTFIELLSHHKVQLLDLWDFRASPVVYLYELDQNLTVKSIDSLLQWIKEELQEDTKLFFLESMSLENLSNAPETKIILLQKCPAIESFVAGNYVKYTPTRFITIVLQVGYPYVEIRCLTGVKEIFLFIKRWAITSGFSLSQVILSNQELAILCEKLLANNSKIRCEREAISYRTEIEENLYTLDTFLRTLQNDEYKLRKIFLSIQIEGLPETERNINIRIFPLKGKLTFTGKLNERQVRASLNEIYEFKEVVGKRFSNSRLQEFF